MICESEQARCHANMGPGGSGRSGHEREIEDQKDAGAFAQIGDGNLVYGAEEEIQIRCNGFCSRDGDSKTIVLAFRLRQFGLQLNWKC